MTSPGKENRRQSTALQEALQEKKDEIRENLRKVLRFDKMKNNWIEVDFMGFLVEITMFIMYLIAMCKNVQPQCKIDESIDLYTC